MLTAELVYITYGSTKIIKVSKVKPAHKTTVNKVRSVLLTDVTKYFTGREIANYCGIGMTEINKSINQLKLAHEINIKKVPGEDKKPARAIRIKQ